MESNLIRALKCGVLTALVAFAPLTCVCAADASKSPTPAAPDLPPLPPLSVNSTTNAASASPATMKETKSGITITTDEDDDDDVPSKGKHSATIKIGGDHGDGSFMDNLEDILIPITGIVFGVTGVFGMPVLVVYFVCYFKHKRRQENLALAKEFLAKGMAIPPQLLDESQRELFAPKSTLSSTAGSDLRKGFKLAFIGLAITLAFYVYSPHSTTWGWGLIPMVMGIGLLVSGAVQSRMEGPHHTTSTPPPATPTPPPSEPPR